MWPRGKQAEVRVQNTARPSSRTHTARLEFRRRERCLVFLLYESQTIPAKIFIKGSSLPPLQGDAAPPRTHTFSLSFTHKHTLLHVRIKMSAEPGSYRYWQWVFSLYTAACRASSIHHTNTDETPQKWTRCWNLRFTLTDGYFIDFFFLTDCVCVLKNNFIWATPQNSALSVNLLRNDRCQG